MYLAIVILPILAAIVSGLFGRKIGVSGAQLITSLSVIVTTILSTVAFFEVGLNNIPVSVNLIRWLDSDSINVLWGFQFDSLTVTMLIPVLIVSSLVHVYSIGYMSNDPHQQRFFSYLSLFTFMMIILVTANNYLLMFVGWEGVGVCSYLLVSFWFTRIAANQSSISAFLTNRVGDCFLTIGMFAILWSFGNVDYSTVFSLAPFVNENIVTIIGICLLIGAMAKSSQVGLHIWLPMAMEGPTPVSALIHAATMVTAGVYLLMRSSPLIEYSSTVLLLCLWLGAITTVFSSLIGLFQYDIKKVIAYSTMSQLGMMVIAVGLSSYNVALFHLVNHAFYKALLFLGAGSVIHAVADNQDFRKYGGLRKYLPLTYSVMLIASLSLVAFPFMTGFYSKDFILESAYGGFNYSGVVVYYVATIGAIFTTLYSVKVLYLTFLAKPNGTISYYMELSPNSYMIDKNKSKESLQGDIFMNIPLIILAIFSIYFGYISKEIFIGLGSVFFLDNSLFIHPIHEIMIDTEFAVNTFYKLLPFVFTVLFSVLAIIISEYYGKDLILFKISRLGYNISVFFNQRFFVELLYYRYISGLILFKLGKQTSISLDKGSVENLGPFGLEKELFRMSENLNNLSNGLVTNYALYISMGLVSCVTLFVLSAINDISLSILCIFGLLFLINYTIHIAHSNINKSSDGSGKILFHPSEEKNIIIGFNNTLVRSKTPLLGSPIGNSNIRKFHSKKPGHGCFPFKGKTKARNSNKILTKKNFLKHFTSKKVLKGFLRIFLVTMIIFITPLFIDLYQSPETINNLLADGGYLINLFRGLKNPENIKSFIDDPVSFVICHFLIFGLSILTIVLLLIINLYEWESALFPLFKAEDLDCSGKFFKDITKDKISSSMNSAGNSSENNSGSSNNNNTGGDGNKGAPDSSKKGAPDSSKKGAPDSSKKGDNAWSEESKNWLSVVIIQPTDSSKTETSASQGNTSRRDGMTEEERREESLAKANERSKIWRANRTEEEKEAHLERRRELYREKRDKMTEEELEAARENDRERYREKRDKMTEEEKEAERKNEREKRANMTEEELEAERKRDRDRKGKKKE